ncbi:hypothetical protein EJB05_13172, partial [Eragrostis curvula]
ISVHGPHQPRRLGPNIPTIVPPVSGGASSLRRRLVSPPVSGDSAKGQQRPGAFPAYQTLSADPPAPEIDTASPEPCSAPTRSRFPRGPPAAASSDGRELPFDLMLDVLLCVPAKDLCRMRAVCRAWRAATVDPLFVRAHAARHPDPLFLANLRDDDADVHVMDLSGAVVKRIAVPEAHQLLCTRLDLACVATEWNSCRVLDPATGAVMPGPPVLWQGKTRNLTQRNTTFALGQIAATGEYKLLRVSNLLRSTGEVEEQRFEVFTINGSADKVEKIAEP